MAGPLEQFKIKELGEIQLGSYDISFTNSSLFMVATVIIIAAFMLIGIRRQLMVPGRWQAMVELALSSLKV